MHKAQYTYVASLDFVCFACKMENQDYTAPLLHRPPWKKFVGKQLPPPLFTAKSYRPPPYYTAPPPLGKSARENRYRPGAV